MKKYLQSILFTTILFFSFSSVKAASFQMTASTHQVAPNQTFTVQVGGDCIGRVDLTVANGTLSTHNVWVEQGYVNVSVTAGSSGTVSVTATPVTGFSDADANLYQPGPRTVVVNISVPSSPSNPPTNPSTKPPSRPSTSLPDATIPKSEDNSLSALTVSVGELSPHFDGANTDYTLHLDADVTTLQIDATSNDAKANIQGLGEIKLNPGNNKIELIVTAENGNQRIYTINAYVDETPQIYLDYKNQKIGIVRNLESVSIPVGFQKEDYGIDDKIIPILTKENLTILYGINEAKVAQFYLYDKEKNQIMHLLIPMNIGGREIYIIEGLSKEDASLTQLTINETEVPCHQFRDNQNYCLLNTITANGNQVEYLYETSENTIQLYPEFLAIQANQQKPKEVFFYCIIGFLLLIIGTLIFIIVKKKGNQNEKV